MKKRRFSGKKLSVITVLIIFIIALVYTATFDMQMETETITKNITHQVIETN